MLTRGAGKTGIRFSARAWRTSAAIASGRPVERTSITLTKFDSSEEDADSPGFHLQQRQKCHWWGLLTRAFVFRVPDHANNLKIAGVAFAANTEAPTDRIFVRQESMDERFGHHRDRP